MSSSRLKRIRRLTQRDVTWLCCTRRAYLWITPKDDGSPYRPYTTLVMDRDREVTRKIQVHGDEPPTPEEVLEVLHKAMLRPSLGSGGRGRPACIFLDSADLVRELAPRLAEIGVRCEHRASLSLMDTWFPRVTQGSLKAQDPIPGLMSVPGVTEPMLRDLFAAAANYYRQAPWRWIENSEPIEVRYPAESSPRYVLVLGSGGEYFGLSLYESLDDLRVALSHHDPDQTHELIPWMSMIFEVATIMAFEDLDALEKHGWAVAGEKAYPWVFKTVPHSDPRLPGASDLAFLAAAMRVLPDFVTDRLKANRGRPCPAGAVYALSGIHGVQDIALSYPVSLIDPEEEALEEYIEDWYWDEPSHEFARQVGKFLFAFMDHLTTTGITESTLRKHESNCWAIGLLECGYGYHDTFSPEIFTGGPSFLYEFKRKFSDSKYAVTSYQATWRKYERYYLYRRRPDAIYGGSMPRLLIVTRQLGRARQVQRVIVDLARERRESPLRAYIATQDDIWREPERLSDGTLQPGSGDGSGPGRPTRKMMWPGLRAWRRVDDFNTLTWCFEGLGRMPPGTQRGLDLGALSQETQAHSRRSAAQRRRRLAERAG